MFINNNIVFFCGIQPGNGTLIYGILVAFRIVQNGYEKNSTN